MAYDDHWIASHQIASLLQLLRGIEMASAETVERAIRSAFSERSVPAWIIDVDIGDKETRQALRAALEGKRWAEISGELLRFHHDALGFLSPVGVRYLLPAFMVAALESPSSPIVDVLVCLLTRPQNPHEERAFLDTMSSLTDPQRGAVRSFLEYLRDGQREDWPDDEPGKALRGYWAAESTS